MLRRSLSAGVIATCVVLLLSICLLGAVTIASSLRAIDHVRALGQHGIVPAVGLSMLNQNLDQQRELVLSDFPRIKLAERRAVLKQLVGLDSSIRQTVPQVLSQAAQIQWKPVWRDYLALRAQYLLGYRPA